MTGALATSGLIGATAANANDAMDCGFHSYSKPSGDHYFPSIGSYAYQNSGCDNIYIKPNTNRYVKVCFYPSGGGTSCQRSYTLAKPDKWYKVATDVNTGTKFRFYFRSDAKSTGMRAH